MRRLWWRLFGGGDDALDPTRADLVVVASSFDDAEACSTALARAETLLAERPVVLRHHLRVPADAVAAVCAIAAQDGYEPAEAENTGNTGNTSLRGENARESGSTAGSENSGGVENAGEPEDAARLRPLVLRRVQLLDALHCSQERSRMAGLAQRHDGFADGWDALQPPPAARP